MTHSDQTMIKRLTGSRVSIGHTPDGGPIYRLSSYDAPAQLFEVLSERLMVPHRVSAAEVLKAKRDGILHVLR